MALKSYKPTSPARRGLVLVDRKELHKGGPDTMVFLVVVDTGDRTDVAIPGRDLGFRKLFLGQAAGDLAALEQADRRVAAVTMDDLRAASTAG